MKVARLSALHTGRLYPRKYSWYSFLLEAESPQCHSAAGMIMSMKNSNRSRDLPVYTAVPQPLRHRVLPLKEGRSNNVKTLLI
jgi:hypothetical protein